MTAQASKAASPASRPRGTSAGTAKPRGPRAAAERAISENSTVIGTGHWKLKLPPTDQLAFLAGVGLLAAIGIIEWPVALVITVGHELAHSHRSKLLREFGDVLEEA